MHIRSVQASDYKQVIAVIDEWWGGRHMADMLPKLFFVHFQETGFVAEDEGQVVAFLIGFVSQTHPDESYIHFIGVQPEYRQSGIAKRLYEQFFETVKQRGCRVVRCVTSPDNRGSIQFHTRMGFAIEPGDGIVEGVAVTTDYDGRGKSRVLFVREIG